MQDIARCKPFIQESGTKIYNVFLVDPLLRCGLQTSIIRLSCPRQVHTPLTTRSNQTYTIDNEIKSDIFSHDDSAELLSHMKSNLKKSKSQIVFLKGFPSSECLLGVDTLCEIDPEFFRLHLQFRDKKKYHTFSSLPSSLEQIIRLRICTINFREDKKET